MVFERIIEFITDIEIVALDEDIQRSIMRNIFLFGGLFAFLIISGGLLYIHLSSLPPDTRTEYQKIYDECVIEEHGRYLTLSTYHHRYDCTAFLDAQIMNDSKIVTTPTNENGRIVSYIIERPQ